MTYRILPWTHQFIENCCYTATHYADTVAGDLQDTALNTSIHWKLLLYSNTLHWHSCWWPTGYCLEHINSQITAVIQQHITLTQLLVTYRILPWTHQFTDNCCYDHLIFTMGFPILVRRNICNESGSWCIFGARQDAASMISMSRWRIL